MATAYVHTDAHGSHTLRWYQRNDPEALSGIRRSKINFMTENADVRQQTLESLGLGNTSLIEPTDVVAGGPDPATTSTQEGAQASNQAGQNAAELRDQLFADDWGSTTAGDTNGDSGTMLGNTTANGYQIKQEDGRFAVLGQDRRVGSYKDRETAIAVAQQRDRPGGFGDAISIMSEQREPGGGPSGLVSAMLIGVALWVLSQVF